MPSQALRLQDLAFAYPGSAMSILVPRLELEAGEHLLLTGGSGSGKSTLLQLIAGLRQPQGGTVTVGDVAFSSLSGAARDAARGRHIGIIFQTFNLLQGFSALDNVLMALMFSRLAPSEHEARARSLLRALDMPHEEQEVSTLSVGQQQRVAVARALAARPTLVLADEPTASLDPQNARAALDLIQSACRDAGAALLCTSHDPLVRERFARIESMESFTRHAAQGATS